MPDDDTRFAPPSPASDDVPLDNLADEIETLAGELDTEAPIAETDDAEVTASAEEDPAPEIRITPAEQNTLDVDSALAAVSGLDDMIAAQEAEEHAEQERREIEEHAEQERREIEERAQQAEAARIADITESPMPTPARLALRRGSLASVLPGAALVGVGIWLTVTYTTGAPPAPAMTAGVLAGVAGLAVLSAWLVSGRWQRGSLFLLLWGGLSAGVVAYTPSMLLVPALLGAAGSAFLLSALLARPMSGKHALPGLLLLAAAGASAAVLLGVIPAQVMSIFSALWIPVAVLVAILLLLPLVVRR